MRYNKLLSSKYSDKIVRISNNSLPNFLCAVSENLSHPSLARFIGPGGHEVYGQLLLGLEKCGIGKNSKASFIKLPSCSVDE